MHSISKQSGSLTPLGARTGHAQSILMKSLKNLQQTGSVSQIGSGQVPSQAVADMAAKNARQTQLSANRNTLQELDQLGEEQNTVFSTLKDIKEKVVALGQADGDLEARVQLVKEITDLMEKIDYTADSAKFQERAAVIGEEARDAMVRFGEGAGEVFSHAFKNISTNQKVTEEGSTLRNIVEQAARGGPEEINQALKAIDVAAASTQAATTSLTNTRQRMKAASTPEMRVDVRA